MNVKKIEKRRHHAALIAENNKNITIRTHMDYVRETTRTDPSIKNCINNGRMAKERQVKERNDKPLEYLQFHGFKPNDAWSESPEDKAEVAAIVARRAAV